LYLLFLLIYMTTIVLDRVLLANLVALFIWRVIQGFGVAHVLSLSNGVVADITLPKGRALAKSIILLGPQLKPALDPLLGGPIPENASLL
jgi:MFS family permease